MIRALLALAALLLLQACSAIKLGYQQLTTLSFWWLDSTVSFNSNQTPAAKEAIAIRPSAFHPAMVQLVSG